MRAYLDDQPLRPDPASADDALRAGANAAQRRGRIIIDIIADGRSVGPDDLGTPSVSPVDELRLVSAEPLALVREALGDARGLLSDLRAVQTRAADAFMLGEFEDGVVQLRDVVGAWQRVRTAAEQAGVLLSTPVESLALDVGDGPRPMRNEIETLAATLSSLRDAITRQDVAALADLLEYDLGALARRWDRLLAAFMETGPCQGRS